MFTDAFANALLGGSAPTHLSLHTAYPGATGANEVSGGGYARGAVTFAAATSRQRTVSGTVSINVPASTTVAWIGAWTAATGGTFYWCAPAGGQQPRGYVVDVTADTIILPGHGYTADQEVVFYDGGQAAPLVEGTIYYVRNPTANTFQVSATAGGTPIDLTSQPGTERAKVCRIIVQPYASAGVAELTNTTLYGLTR